MTDEPDGSIQAHSIKRAVLSDSSSDCDSDNEMLSQSLGVRIRRRSLDRHNTTFKQLTFILFRRGRETSPTKQHPKKRSHAQTARSGEIAQLITPIHPLLLFASTGEPTLNTNYASSAGSDSRSNKQKLRNEQQRAKQRQTTERAEARQRKADEKLKVK